ncbi:WhiB family transcriptional regulator [Amycolatopsis sp. NBC_01480]|uniref:WhiB family transcriptional regulator n=1 Tax=Amycolatopsis sp. NBC_01480 TaxID=2903562 RepID=UPI002E2D4FF1|nr:WhiB family transcriptional regulator [Amycolatopsis sp. NBC_01480]
MAELSRLPRPVTTIWDWQLEAACRDIDRMTFFHPEQERGSGKDDRDRRAKAICSRCPVLQACRRHALLVQEPYGVWGGLTPASARCFSGSSPAGSQPPRPPPAPPTTQWSSSRWRQGTMGELQATTATGFFLISSTGVETELRIKRHTARVPGGDGEVLQALDETMTTIKRLAEQENVAG